MEDYNSFDYNRIGATGWGSSGRLKFKENSSFIVCGRSGSGKTTFISRLLKECDHVFTNDLNRQIEIVYCYKSYQPLFDELKAEIKNINFIKGLPEEEYLQEKLSPLKKHIIVVVDDLMREVVKSLLIFDFFTVRSHHEGASIIYVSHNLYQQGQYSKSISVNAAYCCLFQNPRGLDQIQVLSRQMYPGKNHAIAQAYSMATSLQNYGYLVIDFTANIPQELRLRTSIFPNEVTRFYCF